MIQLLSRSQAQLYKQISNSINEPKFNELVFQAQMVELIPLLGERLYYDIQQNINNYDDLLDGSTYEIGGITYTNVGLRAVLTHYWYAYHSFYGDQIDTAFGLREKMNNDVSSQVSTTMKKTTFEMNSRYAFTLFANVDKFLIRTRNPLYKCGTITPNRHFRINKIG